MIKQFSAGDITVRPFGTFKHWTIQSMDSGALDRYGYSTFYTDKVEINEGRPITGSFYPSSSANYSAVEEPINLSGKYYRNIYSLTNAMFYRYSDDPLKQFGIQQTTENLVTGQKEIRKIHDKIRVMSVAKNVYGESIVPNTVRVVDASNIHQTYNLFDDGYTNLRISGSHFPDVRQIGGVRDEVATPRWVSGPGRFFVTHTNGVVAEVNASNARYYMSMGLPVSYVPPVSGSDWTFDESTATDEFQANNEHFGESVSAWYKYVAVGASMDKYSLATSSIGYVGLYKFDDKRGYHRLVKQLHFPFTQSVAGTLFKDSFGYSVAVRDNTLAIGSPTGSIGNGQNYPGFVCVHDKKKGGSDYWGQINLLKGESRNDRFGHSVSVDKDIMAIGAPGVSGSAGMVYIYRRKKFMNGDACDSIPTSSLYRDILTIEDFVSVVETSSFTPANGQTPTHVSGNFSWQLEAKLTSSIAAAVDNFGWSLEVSDDRLIVGTNKTGYGYAALFTCSYSSASLGACPTASWSEARVFVANSDYADLDMSSGLYNVDVTENINSDRFGLTVAINGDAILIGSPADRAFRTHNGASKTSILGAVYFYNISLDFDCSYYKSFGVHGNMKNNNFAYKVAVNGNMAAVGCLPDKMVRTVDFVSGSYVLENFSYNSTGSEDGVLGRVTLFRDSSGTGSWSLVGDMKRNKEAGKPYNIYGYDIDLSSDYLIVGAPIINTASAANYNNIVNASNQEALMPSSYSGSVFVYELNKFEENKPVGNVFYKNGYIALTDTSSNFSGIFSGTGSAGFEMTFQGSHTIYEHEYLCSVRPGEFNYSTNPTALLASPMTFDVNGDGVFDYADLDLIMRYLQRKKFYEDAALDENGIVLEQSTLEDYSWWGHDMLLTEAEDLLLQEVTQEYIASASLTPYTKAAYDYIQTNLVNTKILDINGDDKVDLLDGNILTLYFLHRLNPTTLAPNLATGSTRIYVKDVVEHLNRHCKKNETEVNPVFLGYQYSSSYDPTGSFLAPVVTTIGLYQENQLVAVAKLGRPIKNLVDWPTNFIVRFDT
jgi:hypothetical protein